MPIHLPDANVLIHCLREESAGHQACRRWLEGVIQRGEPLAITELVEVAFLRITTLPSLRIAPLEVALDFRNDLKAYPEFLRLTPSARHGEIFQNLAIQLGLVGNDLNDAWLAALAIEHDATLVSADEGFRRFPKLRWMNPLRMKAQR